jgi:hypothetical protein
VAGVNTGTPADLQAQLDAARSEVARITEQRDIFQKTLVLLSKPSPNAMNGLTVL